MEMLNFSADETRRINRSLAFISSREVDLNRLTDCTLVIKTENFDDECEQLAPYYADLGLENRSARLVFNPATGAGHKILINKAAITGLSYLHALATELVHLGNLSQFNAEYGNVYRLTPERAIAGHYYEFLLWSRFQAMRIATRVHALASWHEVNGEAPPEDGRYRFAQVPFPGEELAEALARIKQATTITAWRECLWQLLEQLAAYLGRLAFYQQEPRPQDLDEWFPAARLEETVGLANCLALYAALQRARDYPAWRDESKTIRQAIVAMEDRGKRRWMP